MQSCGKTELKHLVEPPEAAATSCNPFVHQSVASLCSVEVLFSSLRSVGTPLYTAHLSSDHSIWTLTKPRFFSLSALLLYISCCSRGPCCWVSVSQAVASAQASHWTAVNLQRRYREKLPQWLQGVHGCKTRPDHYPSTTMLNSWYKVFVLTCCHFCHT